MNNLPSLLNVPMGKKHRSTFPLDFQHMTTQDFGKTTILHSMELMPNDEIDIDMSVMSQLAPMVVPTMGNVNLYVRAFFVPFRFVWSHWEEFFANLSTTKSGGVTPSKVPVITQRILNNLFFQAADTRFSLVTAVLSTDAHDYKVKDSQGAFKYYNLTPTGRCWLQILQGLGYNLVPLFDNSTELETNEMSALPLLCLAKIFRDYYVNPNYQYTAIDSILNSGTITSLTATQIGTLLNFCSYGWFESDVFTSAWANPETPNYSSLYGAGSNTIIPHNYTGSSSLNVNSISGPQATAIPTELNTNGGLITELALNILKQARNFFMRRGISGGRYVDQLFSRFGIKLDNNEARRSTFIGTFETSANVTRVDATSSGFSDETQTNLGDFTGRGTLSGNGHFHYKNEKNDFGLLIFVSHLMPRTSYYQGLKPHALHLDFYDFFNPDLEDVGNAPIPNEVVFDDYTNCETTQANLGSFGGVFGFAPNYYEYKSQMDYMTGDFRCNSLNSQIKSYQLLRELLPPDTLVTDNLEGVPAVLNERFQKADEKNISPYNRMFLNQNNDADHFINSYFFKVRATRDCQSLGNSLVSELNEHGNDVGQAIKVRPNGKFF